jgi:Spy/CpxP family protein refolding chaperone
MRGYGRRLLDQRRQLVDALEEPVPNIARARVLLADLNETIGAQVAARTEVELEILQVLTPEQRSRVRAFRDTKREERGRTKPGARERRDRSTPADTEVEDLPDEPEPPARGATESAPPGETTVPADSAPGRSGAEPGGASPGIRPMQALGLSQEQRQKIRELRRQHGPSMRALVTRIRETRKSLGDGLVSDTIDAERVKKLGVDLGRLEAERARLRFEVEVGFISILTPDQTRRYRELRSERRRTGAPARRAARGLDRP